MELVQISRRLHDAVTPLEFAAPVTHVYNPLDYAREPHEVYLTRFGRPEKEAVLLGMNPGPWGMAQTGVPFGEVSLVCDWLGISGVVSTPEREHPKRPVTGFACARSEVSGARLWGWARDRFGTPDAFFARFFVWNYCPLSFMDAGGRNVTPDKLPASEQRPLFEACDAALREMVAALQPKFVIGVGKFAEQRARTAIGEGVRFGSVLHPSPASPEANRGWAQRAERDLAALGIALD